ncbi:MAG: hypothetical protein K6A89_10995 [Treponema sp.]|nr:hypothetical protein [Treponema sp.]
MAPKTKKIKDFNAGFSGKKNKLGINIWRFFFNGINSISGSEQMFFIEFEMLNPFLSPSETILSFKTKVKFSAEDLQYALAGTDSASNLQTEEKNLPSYCVIRCGMLGIVPKQICCYTPIKQITFKNHPFEIQTERALFTENKISGNISLSKAECEKHPEYFCDSGNVSWEITYETNCEVGEGENTNFFRWFPYGLKTDYSGKIVFDGDEYIINPKKSFGYSERYFGKSLVEPWFHISAENLTSVITGKTLFDSAFAVQGIFDNRVAFAGKFEDNLIVFETDSSKRQFSCVWDCVQMPENDNPEENLLHWSVSLSSKKWIIDIDIFCRIKEIFNRKIEMPDESRLVLNMLQGATGTGEIKLYKRNGSNLEQIEHANLTKVVCEFGHTEQGEF